MEISVFGGVASSVAGYTIGNGGAGVELPQLSTDRPIRVVSVHAIAGIGNRAIRQRLAYFQDYSANSIVLDDVTGALWGGDFNVEPNQNGADVDLLREFVGPSWDSKQPGAPSASSGYWLRSLRTER